MSEDQIQAGGIELELSNTKKNLMEALNQNADLQKQVEELEVKLTKAADAYNQSEDFGLNCEMKLSNASQRIKELEDEINKLRRLLDCRAGKLLQQGKYFIVVSETEPYFSSVYDVIRLFERAKGTWNDEDEIIYQKKVSNIRNDEFSSESLKLLIKLKAENSVLRTRIDRLEAEIDRLRSRDGNATITLCYNDGNNPFAREHLKVCDFGVSDNCYVVESEVVEKLQAKIRGHESVNTQLREKVKELEAEVAEKNGYIEKIIECLDRSDCCEKNFEIAALKIAEHALDCDGSNLLAKLEAGEFCYNVLKADHDQKLVSDWLAVPNSKSHEEAKRVLQSYKTFVREHTGCDENHITEALLEDAVILATPKALSAWQHAEKVEAKK